MAIIKYSDLFPKVVSDHTHAGTDIVSEVPEAANATKQADGARYISTSDPSDLEGSNGDIQIKVASPV